YTLSPELSLAVRTIFKKLYDDKLIYRGERIVNWCSGCGTTLANDEVEYHPVAGQLYYIRYPFSKQKGGLTIATTRPETMLADTAVAVNPKDSRYKKYVGKNIMLPLVNRELVVIADERVDCDFGTGVLKITPGHDPLDFEIGQKHRLPIINMFTPDGRVDEKESSDHGFEEYANLTAEEARGKIIEELKEGGYLEKTEDLPHNVGYCYRSGDIVEPMVSKQWFVSVNQKIPGRKFSLKEIAAQAVKTGSIKIVPKKFEKTYLQWMENLKDWCISRQIWFGHRIPVWYCGNCGEITVEVDALAKCKSCQSTALTQDPDTLDTWFSSSLWTFSTLGWPAETPDLKTYHPTTVLETGYDILFFWVARMVLMTGYAIDDIPFRTVYLHGLVRDAQGKKMSKSKGNAMSPLEIIQKYGADALRLSLCIGISPGNDLKIDETKIQSFRNFVNKFWNISRYILGTVKINEKSETPKAETLADEWILGRVVEVASDVDEKLKKLDFGGAGEELLKFTWNDLADWYIEISKIKDQRSNSQEILPYVLAVLLKLWHPFIPFVSEHIWSQFSKESLMIQEYPVLEVRSLKLEVGKKMQTLRDLVTDLRNIRAEYRQDPKEIFSSYLELPKRLSWIKEQTSIIEKLARVKLNFESIDETKKMPYSLWEGTRVYLIIPGFDPKKELVLTEKILKETDEIVKRLETQLAKKDFLKKAPPEIVEKIKADFETAKDRQTKLQAKIKSLK
ncbi:MAG: valine--tRNA ligase, partial [Candidatus Doudnabacteria bacterium]|nr:valine--tRNA ligase [Candidatus Doudnabacteria bacterium]